MLAIPAILLYAVSYAAAYMVLVPNQSQGWTNVGNQTLTWSRVDTDPLNFTVVLVNQSPTYSQVLDALVDGTLSTTQVNPPSGGWPQGTGFQVNLVKDPTDLNTIYAQSSQFTINSTSSSATTGIPTVQGTPITTNAAVPPTDTDTSNLTPTSSVYQGSSPSGDLPMMRVPIVLLGVIVLISSALV